MGSESLIPCHPESTTLTPLILGSHVTAGGDVSLEAAGSVTVAALAEEETVLINDISNCMQYGLFCLFGAVDTGVYTKVGSVSQQGSN